VKPAPLDPRDGLIRFDPSGEGLDPGDGARHRLLLIEDHAPLAEATAEFMRVMGLDVRIASSGEEALHIAAVFQPEIVLCDLSLPDMPGLHLVETLRRAPGTSDALIAIHTAMSEGDLGALQEHARGSVDLCLSKPLTPGKLAALLAGLETRTQSEQRRPAPSGTP
jgi:CheY-like chemotaxis protein